MAQLEKIVPKVERYSDYLVWILLATVLLRIVLQMLWLNNVTLCLAFTILALRIAVVVAHLGRQ
jgi:hypothetical protein